MYREIRYCTLPNIRDVEAVCECLGIRVCGRMGVKQGCPELLVNHMSDGFQTWSVGT